MASAKDGWCDTCTVVRVFAASMVVANKPMHGNAVHLDLSATTCAEPICLLVQVTTLIIYAMFQYCIAAPVCPTKSDQGPAALCRSLRRVPTTGVAKSRRSGPTR